MTDEAKKYIQAMERATDCRVSEIGVVWIEYGYMKFMEIVGVS